MILINNTNIRCNTCGFNVDPEIQGNKVCCTFCGSEDLLNENGLQLEPVFKRSQEDFYQVSQYTPKLPNRRRINRPYPKIKERRNIYG